MHTVAHTESPRPLTGYAKLIHDIDPTVNPVGVECSMHLQYSTLDHLDWHTFRDEIAIAKGIETVKPGELRRIAATYDRTGEFDAAAAHVPQPENAPTDEAPALTLWTHADRLYVVNAEGPFDRPARMRAVAHRPIATGEDDIAINHQDTAQGAPPPLARDHPPNLTRSTRIRHHPRSSRRPGACVDRPCKHRPRRVRTLADRKHWRATLLPSVQPSQDIRLHGR